MFFESVFYIIQLLILLGSGAPGFLPVRNVEWVVFLLGTLMLFSFKMLVVNLAKPDRMLLLKHSIAREMNADHTALVGAACVALEDAYSVPTSK